MYAAYLSALGDQSVSTPNVIRFCLECIYREYLTPLFSSTYISGVLLIFKDVNCIVNIEFPDFNFYITLTFYNFKITENSLGPCGTI